MKPLYAYAVTGTLLALSACASSGTTPSTTQNVALATCGTEAAALNVLADLRANGKLTASQIALVNNDIKIVDPVCSNKDPTTILSGVAAAAAGELISLAGGS